MKKRWLMTPIVVGLAALTVLGGTAFAQGRGNPEEVASKVAETLQIDWGHEPSWNHSRCVNHLPTIYGNRCSHSGHRRRLGL